MLLAFSIVLRAKADNDSQIQFALLFLFCPETTYLRDSHYNTDTAVDEKFVELAHIEAANDKEHKTTVRRGDGTLERQRTIPEKKTFVQELAIFSGVYSKDSIFKFLIGPFITLLNPAGCYAVLASGLLNSWYVGSAIILSGIFAGPPWDFNAAQIGYLGAGPFLGGMLGSILVAAGSDPLIKWMTKKNNGV